MKTVIMKQTMLFLMFVIALTILNISKSCVAMVGHGNSTMTQKEYEAAKRGQDKFHALLRAGDASFKRGHNQQAEQYYLAAYKFAEKSSSEAVARYVLAKFYKDTGNYEKSLELVNIDLPKLKQEEPGWKMYSEMKNDLLQKIEAQKQGEKIEKTEHVPEKSGSIRSIADFETASYAEQKQYMEKKLPENTEILKLSQQAMLAEHAGKFAEAKGYYEQLLSRKEDVTAAQGYAAWPMLHCAVQRMSELTEGEVREKEMLVWIRDNMLAEQGLYHQSLSGLLPDVRDHLKERLKEFNL